MKKTLKYSKASMSSFSLLLVSFHTLQAATIATDDDESTNSKSSLSIVQTRIPTIEDSIPSDLLTSLKMLKSFETNKNLKTFKDWPKSYTNNCMVNIGGKISNKDEHLFEVNTIPKAFLGKNKIGKTIEVGEWYITSINSSWSSILASKKGHSEMYHVFYW